MLPKPDVVRIVYTRPASPVARVQYASSHIAISATPTRKRRKYIPASANATRKEKRRPAADPPPDTSPIFQHETQPDTGSSMDISMPEVWEGVDAELGTDAETHKQHDDSKFMFFVEAVGSDQCSFLQLTEDIFMANDWNYAKDEASVSIIIIMAEQYMTTQY